jgi:Fic family protein
LHNDFVAAGKKLHEPALLADKLLNDRGSCTVPEIAAITGHSIQTVNQILEHYLPRDFEVASNAIGKLEKSRTKKAAEGPART